MKSDKEWDTYGVIMHKRIWWYHGYESWQKFIVKNIEKTSFENALSSRRCPDCLYYLGHTFLILSNYLKPNKLSIQVRMQIFNSSVGEVRLFCYFETFNGTFNRMNLSGHAKVGLHVQIGGNDLCSSSFPGWRCHILDLARYSRAVKVVYFTGGRKVDAWL